MTNAAKGWARRVAIAVALAAQLLAWGGLAHGAEQVTITVGYYEAGSVQGRVSEVINEIIARFQELHPHIRVETQSAAYGQFFQKLPVELASGAGPDVWLSDGVLVEQYARLGFGLDLTERIARDLDRDDYFGIDLNTDAEGRIWAFPQGLQSSVFFYNKSMFNEAGLGYPDESWTLDVVRENARKLTRDRNGDGSVDQYGFRSFNQVTEGWYPVVRAFGGRFVDESSRRSLVNRPEVADGLRYLVEIVLNDQTSPTSGNMFNHFPESRVAMQYGLFVRTAPANLAGIDYDVTAVPQGPAGRYAPAIVNSWMINAHSSKEKQDAAWEWVKFFSSEMPQTLWTAELGEAIPINRAAAPAFLDFGAGPANRAAFIDGLEYAVAIDPSPVWSGWVDAVTRNFARAFNGQVSVEEAVAQAHQAVQQVLDDYWANR